MKILILGAGKMGLFFADVLSFDHEVAIFDIDPQKLRFTYNIWRLTSLEEVQSFAPELVINAVTLKYTTEAFNNILPCLSETCILSDIASVKNGLEDFYRTCENPFVSTHPMFGPTFASLSDLSSENAIIISESSHLGKTFFRDLYQRLKLRVFEYTFQEHDETIAYSLSVPFASTLVFASLMKHQDAPGTTFKKHLSIAKGLLSEDDFLLAEILFNRYTSEQLAGIRLKLKELIEIVDEKNTDRMRAFLRELRENLGSAPNGFTEES